MKLRFVCLCMRLKTEAAVWDRDRSLAVCGAIPGDQRVVETAKDLRFLGILPAVKLLSLNPASSCHRRRILHERSNDNSFKTQSFIDIDSSVHTAFKEKEMLASLLKFHFYAPVLFASDFDCFLQIISE